MNLPLYMIFYSNNGNDDLQDITFFTTHAARNFLWNNRNKIHDVHIHLFASFTEITEYDLRD